uniref:Uncharacterized protein n=1 Tax=Rhipicephalus pulchellus TaxID=72859 RepID=L7LUX7_RHIPC
MHSLTFVLTPHAHRYSLAFILMCTHTGRHSLTFTFKRVVLSPSCLCFVFFPAFFSNMTHVHIHMFSHSYVLTRVHTHAIHTHTYSRSCSRHSH